MPLSNLIEKSGDLKLYGGEKLPNGYAYCDGFELNRASESGLFSIIGVTHGAGDGSTTFNTPKVPKVSNKITAFKKSVQDAPVNDYSARLVTLGDGLVFMLGGFQNQTACYISNSESGEDGFSSATSFPVAMSSGRASLLKDGRIFVSGGITNGGSVLANTYFGTVSGNTITWMAGTSMPVGLRDHNQVVLNDGRILVICGSNVTANQANTYFGTVSGNTITWVAGTAMTLAGHVFDLIALDDGRVYKGAAYNAGVNGQSHLGVISANTITWTASVVMALLNSSGAALLKSGAIVSACGMSGSGTKTVEIFKATANLNWIIKK